MTPITFPKIKKQDALEIAAQVCGGDPQDFRCYSKKPARYVIYGVIPDEPCWYISAPWGDEDKVVMLRASRVIVISRLTGQVHYDGSADDEG